MRAVALPYIYEYNLTLSSLSSRTPPAGIARMTALHWASRYGHVDCINLLADAAEAMDPALLPRPQDLLDQPPGSENWDLRKW